MQESTNTRPAETEARRTVSTSDYGVIPFPSYCPDWCDREDHLKFAGESEGVYTAEDVTSHRSRVQNCFLHEIRNSANGQVERRDGGSWDASVIQGLRAPYDRRAGFSGPPIVQLNVMGAAGTGACLDLTTGEARVLARTVEALCDHVDLGYLLGGRS